MQTRQWLIPRRPLLPGIFSLFPAYTGASQVMRKRDRSMDVITPLHPQKRLRHLHVIARSGAAAPRRGNPFSLQWHITKRNTLGKSAAVYEFALNAAYFPLSLRGYGLPRRFAPRNDMQKHAACQHGNDVVPGEFAALFRIRPKYYFLLCSAARRTDCHVPSLLAMTC